MKAICVDDDKEALETTVALCRALPILDDTQGFADATHALQYLRQNPVDVVILDVDEGLDGLALASEIQALAPDAPILFLTDRAQYALEAFRIHAVGYMLKPVSPDRLADEVQYALRQRPNAAKERVFARTFGEFDLLIDGRPIAFARAKAKELLAFLVDRQGGFVTRATVAAALWEDGQYDRSKQKYLDVIIRSLRQTLQEHDAASVIEQKRGNLRVCPDRFDCDLYRFFAGETTEVYRGEYMNGYYWANLSEAYLDRVKEERDARR